MMQAADFIADFERSTRIGLHEAIYCEAKDGIQIVRIIQNAINHDQNLLLTRLQPTKYSGLPKQLAAIVDYDKQSQTAIVGKIPPLSKSNEIGVVTAGTSDIGIALESVRTLLFHGYPCDQFFDVGVAGLWRLMSVIDDLRQKSILIVIAGMDAALPTVVAGLVASAVIAVPTSVGYGVAAGGQSALNTILSSCAPGLTSVNIDNGYGAACAAIRIAKISATLQK